MTVPRQDIDLSLATMTRDLLAGLWRQPWGEISPSTYETGRLVTLAPWLAGHAGRVEFLLRGQRPDGGWGGPDGYALVPTLSATEALITELARRAGRLGAAGRPPADITHAPPTARLVDAAGNGLRLLAGRLGQPGLALPDTPAIELIVPALVADLNVHLADPPPALASWAAVTPLCMPDGVESGTLAAVQRRLAAGREVPAKLHHCLEVAGTAAQGAPTVRLISPGTVGASPAATAAWLGGPRAAGPRAPSGSGHHTEPHRQAGPHHHTGAHHPAGAPPPARPMIPAQASGRHRTAAAAHHDHDHPDPTRLRTAAPGTGPAREALRGAGSARESLTGADPAREGRAGAGPAREAQPAAAARYRWFDLGACHLAAIAARYGGPVPSVVPITTFERAWVLDSLLAAGVYIGQQSTLARSLAAGLGPAGVPGGAGLPPDADTTALTLLTLARLGHPRPVTPLWSYLSDDHFQVWAGERSASVTANAHAIALLDATASADPRTRPTIARVCAWLQDRQDANGSWQDKWHASPYYATSRCAVALHRLGGPAGALAAARAARWVHRTQRPDGSWGRFTGTAEETAYALTILTATTSGVDRLATDDVVARGRRYLIRHIDDDHPPLWHDKDLYTPAAVVRAAIIAALHRSRP